MPKFVPYTPAFITAEAEPPLEFTAKDGWRDAPIAQRAAAMPGFSTWLKAEPDGRGRVWVRAWFAEEQMKLPIGYIESTREELFALARAELAAISATLSGVAGDAVAYADKQAGLTFALGELAKRLSTLKLEESLKAANWLGAVSTTPAEAGRLQQLTDGIQALEASMPVEFAG